MASITVRNLEKGLKRRLRIREDENGRSMEEEARDILSTALYHKPQSRKTRRTPFVPDLHPWTRPSWTFLPFTHAHDLLIR